jgi:hypothetical protein
MKIIAFIMLTGCLIGCAATQQLSDITPPRLVVQQTLPIFTENINNPPRHIDMSLFITVEGTVSKVQLLSSSGSVTWDSLVVEKIRQWKFIPASMNDRPVSTWYQFQANIHYETPKYMSLAEVICKTPEDAAKAFELLKQNQDFGELAKQFTADTSHIKVDVLGEIDINCYPKNIRRILTQLNADEFTNPLNLDHEYYIFKRLKD